MILQGNLLLCSTSKNKHATIVFVVDDNHEILALTFVPLT